MHIRPAKSDEIPAMQALELDAAKSYGTLPEYAFCMSLPARDHQEHAAVRSSGVALIAEREGVMGGFLLLLPVDGRAHILEAAVAFAYQRQGIGGALFAAAESWARQASYAEITLTTFRDVPWNAPYYQRLGYTVFKPDEDRLQLRDLIAEERAAGFARATRVVMRRPLT